MKSLIMNDTISDLEDALQKVTLERDKLKSEIHDLEEKLFSVNQAYCNTMNNGKCVCVYDNHCRERIMLMHPSVEKVRRLAACGEMLTAYDWQDILGVLALHMEDFYINFLKEQQHLTEQEFKVCVLTRLHFVPTEISSLLGLSQQRITNIRSAANYKLFQKRGTNGFDNQISTKFG